jgi:hypothetical protein
MDRNRRRTVVRVIFRRFIYPVVVRNVSLLNNPGSMVTLENT